MMLAKPHLFVKRVKLNALFFHKQAATSLKELVRSFLCVKATPQSFSGYFVPSLANSKDEILH